MELENFKNENGSIEAGNVDSQNDNIENTQKSFTQDDVNKIVSKRLERERAKWEKDFEGKLEEAEKVARMSTEEKYQHELNKKEQELSIKEKEITTRELKIQAYAILKEKDLPSDLMEILNYSDIDSLNRSIEVAEASFRSAIEKSVNDRLRGKTPVMGYRKSGNTSSDPFLEGLKKK